MSIGGDILPGATDGASGTQVADSIKGDYNAGTNTPDLETPSAGVVKEGFSWQVSVAGTFLVTEVLEVGDILQARQDDPTTLAHWRKIQANVTIATETAEGLVELATQVEVDAGVDASRVVTPATLAATPITPAAHDLGGAEHNADTLANFNLKLSDATLVDTGDARFSDDRAPTNHASDHTDGTDDIQDATAGQKGLATSTQITKLDGIEALAKDDLTGAEIKALYEAEADTNAFADADVTTLGTAEQSANKNANNGYAPLDGSALVPLANLPASVLTGSEYKGVWNATTNTPTLADGVGANGDYHRCNVAGSVDFGAGSITFEIGDLVLFNGTTSIWENVSGNPDLVQSVAGKQGVVTLDAADIAETAGLKILTSAERTKLSGIETLADVTDATNVDAAGAVMETDFDANTILAADSDNTPAPLTIAAQRVVGRIGGNIVGLTAAEILTLINVEADADVNPTDAEIKTSYQSEVPLISQGDAEAGTATGIENWSALRVAQSIAALATGGSNFLDHADITLSANQNNWDPGDARVIRVDVTGGTRDVTGLLPTGGNDSSGDGRVMDLWNVSTTNDFKFVHQSGSSGAGNRFLNSAGADLTIARNEMVRVWHDPTTNRWRVMG